MFFDFSGFILGIIYNQSLCAVGVRCKCKLVFRTLPEILIKFGENFQSQLKLQPNFQLGLLHWFQMLCCNFDMLPNLCRLKYKTEAALKVIQSTFDT